MLVEQICLCCFYFVGYVIRLLNTPKRKKISSLNIFMFSYFSSLDIYWRVCGKKRGSPSPYPWKVRLLPFPQIKKKKTSSTSWGCSQLHLISSSNSIFDCVCLSFLVSRFWFYFSYDGYEMKGRNWDNLFVCNSKEESLF